MRGDLIVSVENLKPIYARANHPENDETWIVTTVCDDMVRAKCERAPNWRQAFYVSKMNLAKRSSENRANRKRNIGIECADTTGKRANT